MKIEIEIDDNRIVSEVIEKLFQHMRFEVERKVNDAMKGEMMLTLSLEIRKRVTEKIPSLQLSDGRTIFQYMDDLLTKRVQGGTDWRSRSRIEQLVDDQIFANAQRLFAEIAEPYVAKLKEGIIKSVVEQAISALSK